MPRAISLFAGCLAELSITGVVALRDGGAERARLAVDLVEKLTPLGGSVNPVRDEEPRHYPDS